mmetsp:Transcript_5745/g.16734  ORF Transcript_5745/g.16734 Transcript_5745/m.16734 type:complete len:323 (+) Transcript_5745:437-1405(+)
MSASRRSSYCLSRSARFSRMTSFSFCVRDSFSASAFSSAHCLPSFSSRSSSRRLSSMAACACACSSITLRRRASRSRRDCCSSALRVCSRLMNESVSCRITPGFGSDLARAARCVSGSSAIRPKSVRDRSSVAPVSTTAPVNDSSNSLMPSTSSAAARVLVRFAARIDLSLWPSSKRSAAFSRSACRCMFSRCFRRPSACHSSISRRFSRVLDSCSWRRCCEKADLWRCSRVAASSICRVLASICSLYRARAIDSANSFGSSADFLRRSVKRAASIDSETTGRVLLTRDGPSSATLPAAPPVEAERSGMAPAVTAEPIASLI